MWELVFDEDTLCEFDAEASQPFDTQSFESARSGSKKKLFGTKDLEDEDESTYYTWIAVTIVGALLLIGAFSSKMKMMIDMATILSFMTAPVLAILNYKVITSKDVPEEARIPVWLNVLSIAGMVFLVGFALLFVKVRFLG